MLRPKIMSFNTSALSYEKTWLVLTKILSTKNLTHRCNK